jgi:hypothetical protein
METIFDHNVTGIELEMLNSFIPSNVIKSREIYIEEVDGDISCTDLYHLYVLRGENSTAEKYLMRIKNPQYRNILSAF